jgi:hypothetical protein
MPFVLVTVILGNYDAVFSGTCWQNQISLVIHLEKYAVEQYIK